MKITWEWRGVKVLGVEVRLGRRGFLLDIDLFNNPHEDCSGSELDGSGVVMNAVASTEERAGEAIWDGAQVDLPDRTVAGNSVGGFGFGV